MKNISIYWKTISISVAIILLTTGILLGLLSILAPTLTQTIQEEAFADEVDSFLDMVEEKGSDGILEEKDIREYGKRGLAFVFFDSEGQFVLPLEDMGFVVIDMNSYESSNELIVEGDASTGLLMEDEMFRAAISGWEYGLNQYYPMDSQSWIYPDDIIGIVQRISNKTLYASRTIHVQGGEYTANISKTLSFTLSETQVLIRSIYPYFISVGIIVSLALSILYARFFASKIDYLAKVMKRMRNKTYEVKGIEIQGDELQRLENDVSSLYVQLMDEIEVVKKLEEERQLFLRGVTHELKTPIMVMGVTIEGILSGIEEYQDSEEALRDCYRELQLMSNLVNEILDLARIESIKDIGNISVHESISETVEEYEYLAEDKNLIIQVSMIEDMQIKMPANHFKKVISNMISNMIKYSPESSKCSIAVTKEYVHFINPMHSDANIDTNKIFDAFVTYGNSQNELVKSHGLGLYIVASVLKQYHLTYQCWVDEQNAFHFKILK